MTLGNYEAIPFFLKAVRRIGDVYSEKIDRLDLGRFSAQVLESEDFIGNAKNSGMIERALFLLEDKKIDEKDFEEIVSHLEKIWSRILK